MKSRLRAMGCALIAAILIGRAGGQCQVDKPLLIPGVQTNSFGGAATLIGFSELTHPSAPPKKYRRKVIGGTMHWGKWSQDCSVGENPDNYAKSGSDIGIPGIPFHFNYNAALTPVGSGSGGTVLYKATAISSSGFAPAIRITAADSFSGSVIFRDGETKALDPARAPYFVFAQAAYVFWQGIPGSGAAMLNALRDQYRDEWNLKQEYDQDDATGGALVEFDQTSVRYFGRSGSFPLSSGGTPVGLPNVGAYPPLVTEEMSETSRKLTGSGNCIPLTPSGSGKALGSYSEELSVEDKEEDAMRRAFALDESGDPASPFVHRGSEGTAFRTSRTNGFDIQFNDVEFEVPVNITCEGDYQVRLAFRKTRRGSGFGIPFTRILEKHFKPGQQTLRGHLDIRQMTLQLPGGGSESLDYDTDYTFLGASLVRGCDREDPGAVSFRRDSVHLRLGLGHDSNGHTAGALSLEADDIGAGLYSPAALSADTLVNGATVVVRDSEGILRQMKGPSALADVVVLNQFAYEVRFYAAGDVGQPNPADGLFAVVGSPFVVFRIEDPDAGNGGSSRLLITESRGGAIKTTRFVQDRMNSTWEFSEGNGLRREQVVQQTQPALGRRTERVTILASTDAAVQKLDRTWFAYPWGEEIISEVLDPDGAALATVFEYHDIEGGPGYGQLKQRINPDGSWEVFTYDAAGRPLRSERPFATGGQSPPAGQAMHLTENSYDTVADADGDGQPEMTVTTIETTLGRETARKYAVEWSKPVDLGGDSFIRRSEIRCVAAAATWDDPGNLVTELLIHPTGPFEGRSRRQLNPDGTIVLTAYAVDGSGQTTTTVKSGAPNAAGDDVASGTRIVTFTSAQGRVTGESVTDIASTRQLVAWTATQFDALGRPTRLDYADGTYEARDYACCGLATQRDRSGAVSTYQYDALGRQTHVTRDGLTTRTEFDPAGRITSVIRIGSDNSEIALETNQYDLAGRLTQRRDALNRLTTMVETLDPATGWTTRTTTNPDGGTRIEVSARGGSMLSIGGSAAAPRSFEYGVDDDGLFSKEILVGEGGAATEWTKNCTDFVGRASKTIHADGAASRSFYNARGQLERQVDPDGVSTLFGYNALGELEVTAFDMDGNGTIEYGGIDRITRTIHEVGVHDTQTVQRNITQVWETEGQDVPATVSVSEQTPDGLRSWQSMRGLVTGSVTVFEGSGGRTVTTIAPDGVQNIQSYSNGRLVSTTVKTAGGVRLMAVTNSYDAHGRLQTSTDARNGTTTYVYNADDTIRSVTTPDPDPARPGPGYDPQTTGFAYDPAGRVSEVTLPGGGVVYTTYWPTGALKRTWGARIYPVEYSYDPQGRVRTMTTWQDFTGNSGRAVTTWNYHPLRGWLDRKIYADNSGPAYSYRPSGRTLTRLWARGVLTTYGYDNAGEISSISYSDGTPAVLIGHARSGRPAIIADGSGTRTLSYHVSGQLQDELQVTGPLGNLGVHRTFDSLSRLDSVSAVSASTGLSLIGYAYDTASRLDTVTQGSNTASYGYLPDSPLVGSVTFRQGGATRLVTTKNYDNLDRLSGVISQISDLTSQISAAYDYNSANQRIRVTRENNARWDYTYDSLGQVTSGRKSDSSDGILPGHDFAWSYDDIGNRKTAASGSRISNYTANLLNQYDRRTVPGSFDLLAVAGPDARVSYKFPDATGTWAPVPREGDFLHQELTADNSLAGVNAKVRVMGVKPAGGPDGEDIVTDITRSTFLPKTPVTYDYDADGNLTGDGRWMYAWDGENRLVSMETAAAAVSAGVGRQKLEFAYDAQGRRIAKNLYDWDGAAWVLGTSTRFLYDGWNLLAELNALNGNSVIRTYAWGLDLSGSLQGAGGVGGLLFTQIQDPGSQTPTLGAHAPCYDGNGNVLGYVDLSTGAKSATYEFNAFGETIIADGPAQDSFPFRFSTKYTDTETGLLYYGLRYYSLSTGRWLSRDPSAETGGSNLYCFVTNDAISRTDFLGMWETRVHHAIVDGWLPDMPYGEYKVGCCKIDVKWQLKSGSDTVDAEPFSSHRAPWVYSPALLTWTFLAAQSTGNAYQHAMSESGELPDTAKMKADRYINENIFAARMLINDYNKHGRDCYYIVEAIRRLGRAYHTFSDSLSPSHEDSKLWWGPLDGSGALGQKGYLKYLLEHKKHETFEVYSQRAPSIVGAVKLRLQGTLDDILNKANQ